MGTVFGYIAGQGVASALSSLGLLGGITLNYSGTQAIMTMVLVMVVVVLSSLVPAYLAGRLAVPSESMRWAVPEPKDDTITDTLPFTVTGRTAPGVLMFLQEYFDAHREGSIGNFSTDALRLFHIRTGDYEALGLACTIWLAPYDLGVRQQLTLNVRATEDEDVLELDLMLHRGSGQENHWWRLNHVFLGDLRRQLLGWRNLSPDRMLDYIARGEAVRAELARTPAEGEKEEAVAALNP
jgi:hypothetical protein